MQIPELTSAQWLVLSLLLDEELSGRVLREKLAEKGRRSSSPAFYQFMARLEEAGHVQGHYVQKIVGGHAIKERFYKITASGIRAQNDYEIFVATRGGFRLLGGAAS
jgi:DNA-binding PadR family transcriptional regulator